MAKISNRLLKRIQELGKVGIAFDITVWWKDENTLEFVRLAESLIDHGYSEDEAYVFLKDAYDIVEEETLIGANTEEHDHSDDGDDGGGEELEEEVKLHTN